VIARSIDPAGHPDHDRRPGGDPGADQLVGPELRLVVVAQEALAKVTLVGFVDRLTVGVPEDDDGRRVHDPGRTGPGSCVEDPGRDTHVRIEHCRPRRGRDPDSVGTGDVDERVRRGEPEGNFVGLAQVAHDELDAKLSEAGCTRRITDDGQDLVAPRPELAGDDAADEAGSTGDDDAHQWPLI